MIDRWVSLIRELSQSGIDKNIFYSGFGDGNCSFVGLQHPEGNGQATNQTPRAQQARFFPNCIGNQKLGSNAPVRLVSLADSHLDRVLRK